MNNATPHANAYRPDIDGLRAVAVLGVVIYHAFPEILRGGFVGVDVFFVISGFLIGGIILRDLAAGNFSFLHFYARRVLRIFPALVVVLCTVLAAGCFLLFTGEYEALGKHAFGGAAFIANLMYYAEAGYWDMTAGLKPLLHLWSLGVEEQFYFVIPILLAVAWKWKFRPAPILLVLLIASFVCNIRYYRSHEAFDFYMPFTRFWQIFMGVLLASLTGRARPRSLRLAAAWDALAKNDWRYARLALSVAGLVFLIIGLDSRGGHYPGHRAIWPTFGAMFLIAAGPRAWLNRNVLSNKLAVAIGLVSYPLYLWHWPLLSFAIILNGEFADSRRWLVIRIVCVLLSFVLAVLTYFLVERPIRFGKGGRKAKIAVLAILMVCVGGTGLSISLAGAPKWQYMAPYQAKVDAMAKILELANPRALGGDILRYIPDVGEKGIYASYEDAGGKRTVAVIGDSHAPPVFEGMRDLNRSLGLNTVGLTYSPRIYPEVVLDALKNKADISDVFLVTRGVAYFANGVDLDNFRPETNPVLLKYFGSNFKIWLQKLADELRGAGKRFYIVTENPVFPSLPHIPVERPFALSEFKAPSLAREDVYNNQKAYLDMLSTIQGAEIINGMDVLCPGGGCSLFSEEGVSLYFDDDHLSTYGGRYLVKNLLAPYLSAIAERREQE